MSPSIAEANAALRQAVEIRRENQAAGLPHEDWYGERVTKTLPERLEAEDSLQAATRLSDEDLQQQIEEHHLHRSGLTQDELDEALERLVGDGITHEQRPGSLPFLEKLEVIRKLHFKKTAEYGDPQDPFANVTASAKCGVEPWRRALCDASDCSVRLQRYANGQPVDFENAIMDNINWLLICWVKHDEAKRA